MIKKILALIKWGIRIAVVIMGIIKGNFDYIVWTLVAELVLSAASLARTEPDQYFAVITGFDGNGDTGYYAMNDNKGARIFGFICLIGAWVIRGFLLTYLATNGESGAFFAALIH